MRKSPKTEERHAFSRQMFLTRPLLERNNEQIIAKYGKIDILLNAAGSDVARQRFRRTRQSVRPGCGRRQSHRTEPFRHNPSYNGLCQVNGRVRQGLHHKLRLSEVLRPLTRVAGYGVAKAAVANWTKYLCAELAIKFGEGLRVNAIAPRVPSDEPEPRTSHQQRRLLTARSHTILAHTPIGRFLEPDELVGTLHYLASDASKAVTGTVSVIDGGFDAFSSSNVINTLKSESAACRHHSF